MKILTLVRHTAPGIARGICYGQLDVDVAESFAAEAAAVANLLEPVELIITSPLQRTRLLAEHLAVYHGCEILQDSRLMEMHFGDWEGRAWNDIAHCEIDAWSADVLHYRPPNGESAQQMMQRVHGLMQYVAKLPQRQIALVAHGGSIRAWLAQLAGIPLSHTLDWQIDYGAVIGSRQHS
ncbi:MAG TPA: alpha-ribazole phosphatase [Gallionellaceae bacterium]|nr:alpha-ribazole phosphatase [Gallionellaceae bacterium]